MNYIKFSFIVEPVQPGSDVLIALLGENGFESFSEAENGFDAFVQESELDRNTLPQEKDVEGFSFTYTEEKQEQKNWNAEWEKSFSPVFVEDYCCIRAPFHEKPNGFRLDILITPKMSFGTGHHDTTRLMTKNLFETEVQSKTVLDMGCGTAVLAIVAKKLGAKKVVGIDIDDWSVENGKENCDVNGVGEIEILKGDASLLGTEKFDLILANINRNVLLKDIPVYASVLNPKGKLMLSGFFESDFDQLINRCAEFSLNLIKKETSNTWGILVFEK
ncbi:MAG: 50S ribosomal protein L11 methyltransferase [Bacteroidia bacterium]|nr:50S ribosomal protein L11 methyltransferase [Bacteroidia bacterium]